MLNYRKLTMQNFLIFGEKVEIEFGGTGIRYIYGENLDITEHDLAADSTTMDERDVSSGSGKSTLPIGLLYAQHGIVWKKDKIPLSRIVNKKHKKNCEVTLEFDIDGKDIYCIKRYRDFKPYGNTVFFFKWDATKEEWIDRSCADSDETQERIDKVIGVNYTTALKTILFSRDEVKDFLDLTAGDRFKIFENIIQLNKFKEKFDIVDKQRKLLEKEIAVLINDRDASIKSKAMVQGYLTTEKNAIGKAVNDRQSRIEAATRRLAEIGDVDSVEVQISSLVSIYKQQLQYAADFVAAKKTLDGKTEVYAKLVREIQKAETLIESYERDLAKEPKKCLACGEVQDKQQHTDHQSRIQKLLDDQRDVLQQCHSDAEAIKIQCDNLNAEIAEIRRLLQETVALEKTVELQDAVKKIIYAEVKANTPVHLHDEVKSLVATITELKEQKADYTRAINYVRDIRKLNKDIRDFTNARKIKEKTLDICSIWLKVLDIREETSIKQLVIAKIIPAFNSILQEILDEIYNGLMKIQFDTYMNEVIEYESDESKKSELSTGERARINLCICFAVRELTTINMNAANALFMDEVFNSMDVYSINKFIALIKRRYAKQALVHIVSHSKGVEENLEADQIIKIQRKDRESKIIFVKQ